MPKEKTTSTRKSKTKAVTEGKKKKGMSAVSPSDAAELYSSSPQIPTHPSVVCPPICSSPMSSATT